VMLAEHHQEAGCCIFLNRRSPVQVGSGVSFGTFALMQPAAWGLRSFRIAEKKPASAQNRSLPAHTLRHRRYLGCCLVEQREVKFLATLLETLCGPVSCPVEPTGVMDLDKSKPYIGGML